MQYQYFFYIDDDKQMLYMRLISISFMVKQHVIYTRSTQSIYILFNPSEINLHIPIKEEVATKSYLDLLNLLSPAAYLWKVESAQAELRDNVRRFLPSRDVRDRQREVPVIEFRPILSLRRRIQGVRRATDKLRNQYTTSRSRPR